MSLTYMTTRSKSKSKAADDFVLPNDRNFDAFIEKLEKDFEDEHSKNPRKRKPAQSQKENENANKKNKKQKLTDVQKEYDPRIECN